MNLHGGELKCCAVGVLNLFSNFAVVSHGEEEGRLPELVYCRVVEQVCLAKPALCWSCSGIAKAKLKAVAFKLSFCVLSSPWRGWVGFQMLLQQNKLCPGLNSAYARLLMKNGKCYWDCLQQ